MTSHRNYEEVIINADVFVFDRKRLWLYNATLAWVFFVTPGNKIKIEHKISFSKHLLNPSWGVTKACLETSGPRGIFPFHFRPLGMRFHTISLPSSSHHPWTINISISQSIFIIKHMPNAVCGCEDTGLLFIHLIYLYFFPEGETLVSIHLCWLLAITEHLELLLNWPEGSTILERLACFRAKRCVCCVCFSGEITESYHESDSEL